MPAVGWHVTAETDGQGRPRGRRPGEKTTADIWWRKGFDDVDFGSDEDLRKLSYYPASDGEGVPPEAGYDPTTQLPGLSHEETFQLDVSGYLHVPAAIGPAPAAGALCQEAAARLAAAEADGTGLDPCAGHPASTRLLTAMCGEDYRQNSKAERLLPPDDGGGGGTAEVPLRSVESPELSGKDYSVSWDGIVAFRGVRTFWNLGGSVASVCIVPASHLSAVPPPAHVLRGDDHMGASVTVALQPGDLLVTAATLLWGPAAAEPPAQAVAAPPPLAERLLVSCEYVCSTSYPTAGYDAAEPPAWLSELSEEQRQVLIRLTGAPMEDRPQGDVPSIHGAELSGAERHGIDMAELWFFDLTGYLVLPGVMDREWVAAANQAYTEVSLDPEEVLEVSNSKALPCCCASTAFLI
jgi:hypothetical protein